MLRGILVGVANTLRERGGLDESESFIDAMFSSAKGGGAKVGPTKRGKGVKIMGIVDREGRSTADSQATRTSTMPLSVSTHAANHHEVTLVQLSFEFYMIEATPKYLIGDKAYDSDPLDTELKVEGVEMVTPPLLRDDSTGLAELAADLRPAPRGDRCGAADRRVRAAEAYSSVGRTSTTHLSWNEIRARAADFARECAGAAYEKGETQSSDSWR